MLYTDGNKKKVKALFKNLIFFITLIIAYDQGYGLWFMGVFTLYLCVRYHKPMFRQMKLWSEFFVDKMEAIK